MAKAKKLPSGNWRVNLYDGKDKNGKRVYKSFTAETKKDAEYLAARYAATKFETSSSTITVGKATEEYIKSKENILSPTTLRNYNHILDYLMADIYNIKVRDITQQTIQKAVNKLAVHYSPKTCRNFHGLLSSVLKIHRPELILRTTLPQKKKKAIYVPDPQEVEEISRLAVDTKVYIPFLLATQCGLRASEISGLELKDVHPDHIEVTQARVVGKDGEVLKQPKSTSGYRKIPIDKELYAILVSNADGERVCKYRSYTISHLWCDFRTDNGLNKSLNFHALRHHFASKCLLLSLPQLYIAQLMGHKDTTMIEQVYQHVFESAMENYANKIRQYDENFFNATRNATR